MSSWRLVGLGLALCCFGGCGQDAGGGAIAPATSTSPQTTTPAASTPLSITATNLVLTGSITADSPTAYVLVNGERATITGGTWSYTLRSVDARNQTVRVQLYVNGLLSDATEINVSTSK